MFLAPKVGRLWPFDALLHGLCFQNSPQLIQRMEWELGWGDKRKREGSGEGNGGWMVVWWEDQTHCHAKKHPLHPPHPEPCIPTVFFPSAPLGRVKPPLTGSGSSVPASSGRCWGSSFDGLLTSHQPSGCHCDERQKQMLDFHNLSIYGIRLKVRNVKLQNTLCHNITYGAENSRDDIWKQRNVPWNISLRNSCVFIHLGGQKAYIITEKCLNASLVCFSVTDKLPDLCGKPHPSYTVRQMLRISNSQQSQHPSLL